MTVTPQTNTTLQEIAERIDAFDTLAICGHVSPDGDCLGSELALAAALRAKGKRVITLLARNDAVDKNLAFMEGFDLLLPAGEFTGAVDCFIAVDVPLRERLIDAARVMDRAKLTVTIDHHAVDQAMSELSYTDPDAASTSILVWQLIDLMGVERTAEMATCCYAGLMTDTGRFQYQNADELAFSAASEMVAAGASPADIARSVYQNRRLASVKLESVALERMEMMADGQIAMTWLTRADFKACDADKSDSEPIIDVLRSIEGVRVACVLRDTGVEVRGSFRAKDDTDVAAIAREYNGGGHRAAAGFTLTCPMGEAVERVRARLLKWAEEE